MSQDYLQVLLGILTQFTGGRGGIDHIVVNYGIAGLFYAVLLGLARSHYRQTRQVREYLLQWGFAFGLSRELFMLGLAIIQALGLVQPVALHALFPPLEHLLYDNAMIFIAGAYLHYFINRPLISRRYLQFGLSANFLVYAYCSGWWAEYIQTYPDSRFGKVWCDWLFHSNGAFFLLVATTYIFCLSRLKTRCWVALALGLFTLSDFLKLPDMALDEVYEYVFTPVARFNYLLGIFLLGYVYFQEYSAEHRRMEQKLMDLSVAIENSPASVMITDSHANIQYVNERFSAVTGYAKEAVLGQNPRLLQSGLTPQATYRDLWQTISAGQAWQGEMINRRLNGDTYWEEMHIAPILDQQGEISQYVGIKLDITDKKAILEALRESECKFAKVFQHSPVAMAITRMADGSLVDVNQAFLTIFGYSRDELLGRTINEFKLWPDRAYRDQVMAQLLDQGAVHDLEFEHRRDNGEMATVLLSLHSLEIAEEACVIGFILDISRRKCMEQALRRENEKNLALLHNASDGIHILDENGKLLEVSDSFCNMLGYSREHLLGMHVSLWDSVGNVPELMQIIRQNFASPTINRYERLHRHRDGSVIAVEITSYRLQLDGKPVLFASARDICERKRLEAKIAASAKEIQDLYDYAPCGYHSLAADGTFLRINETELAWLGYQREEVIGKMNFAQVLNPAGLALFQASFPKFLQNGHIEELELELVSKHGAVRSVSLSAEVIRDAKGEFLMTRSVVYDISALKQIQTELRQLTLEQTAILENGLVGIMKVKNRRIVWKNHALTQMFGYAAHELRGQSTQIFYADVESYQAMGELAYAQLKEQGVFRKAIAMQRKDGEQIWMDVSGVMLPQEDNVSLWMMVDITAMHKQHEEVERIAYHDVLTGLPNRLLIADRLKQALAVAERAGQMLAVCYLDLDGFKPVNDQFGHAAGDELLLEIARRMQTELRSHDTVGRIGGDEFVLLLTGLINADEYRLILQRLIHAINQPIMIDPQHTATVSASIGVTLFPADSNDPDQLLRHADQAMYQAKKAGRNRHCQYDPNQI